MSEIDELRDSIRQVTQATGDPDAWRSGLTDREIADLSLYPADPAVASVVLNKVRSRHPAVFRPRTTAPGDPTAEPAAPGVPEGSTADAIRSAEHDLAQQRSVAAQLDLHAIGAILGAHSTTVSGDQALDRLQHEIEAAVRSRTDLDTPAGARDFQRYLITKLEDIRRVVETADLDSSSKAALMAAWTALYGSAGNPEPAPRDQPSVTRAGSGNEPSLRPHGGDTTAPAGVAGIGSPPLDPLLESLLAGDPLLDGMAAPASAERPATLPIPAIPAAPTGLGGPPTPPPTAPAGAAMPPWPAAAGDQAVGREPVFPRDVGTALDDLLGLPPELDDLSGPLDAAGGAQVERSADDAEDAGSDTEPEDRTAADTPEDGQRPVPSATVRLPDGQTVTAPSVAIAEAIRAATAGTPVVEAFGRQGIAIPPPGDAPDHPVDPSRLTPGDIGVFTDRHAVALGAGKALLDNHIQPTGAISGPSFLGWTHPPEPEPVAPSGSGSPPRPSGSSPAPTRPANVGTDS